MKMDMFCKIMNRIWDYAAEQGVDLCDVKVRIHLIDGKSLLIRNGFYDRYYDYIEVTIPDEETTHFIPIENIVSIEI